MIKDTNKYRNLVKKIKRGSDKEQQEILLALLDYICLLETELKILAGSVNLIEDQVF